MILTTSGYIFDEYAIKSYLNEFKKCPITGMPSTHKNLIECKNSNNFKCVFSQHTDLITLLEEIKNQWQKYILEYFQLKNNLLYIRQELILSYYQNDAAYRALVSALRDRNKLKKVIFTLKKLLCK
mmetsp:Transcript_8600/g.10399  ORF Transcript_8600/g.10399 Transcript_8600/m.10399 type:complete len:126 (-) Transcript_8600:172-549(-)